METPRLILRPFNESDAKAAHVWFSDPEVFRFYTYGPYSLDETAKRIREYMLHFEKHRFAKCFVLEKSTGVPIGDAGLSFTDDMRDVHVGYKFMQSGIPASLDDRERSLPNKSQGASIQKSLACSHSGHFPLFLLTHFR